MADYEPAKVHPPRLFCSRATQRVHVRRQQLGGGRVGLRCMAALAKASVYNGGYAGVPIVPGTHFMPYSSDQRKSLVILARITPSWHSPFIVCLLSFIDQCGVQVLTICRGNSARKVVVLELGCGVNVRRLRDISCRLLLSFPVGLRSNPIFDEQHVHTHTRRNTPHAP